MMPRSLPRLPALRSSWPWDRAEDPTSPVPASDNGFDNPMFDVVSRHHPGSRGCSGLWAGGGRAPARRHSSASGDAMQSAAHPVGLLLSPGLWDHPTLPWVTSSSVASGTRCWVSFVKGFASLLHPLLFPPSLLQEPPSIDTGEEMLQEMGPKDHQVFYLNPLYDASETET